MATIVRHEPKRPRNGPIVALYMLLPFIGAGVLVSAFKAFV